MFCVCFCVFVLLLDVRYCDVLILSLWFDGWCVCMFWIFNVWVLMIFVWVRWLCIMVLFIVVDRLDWLWLWCENKWLKCWKSLINCLWWWGWISCEYWFWCVGCGILKTCSSLTSCITRGLIWIINLCGCVCRVSWCDLNCWLRCKLLWCCCCEVLRWMSWVVGGRRSVRRSRWNFEIYIYLFIYWWW